MKGWALGLTLITMTLIACAPAATAPIPSDRAHAVVVRVIDGDTVDLRFGTRQERVRLIGIDTPETKKPNTPVQCFGPQASDFTKHALAPGTPVIVKRDVQARDDYGRLLGYVYRVTDGLFINLELARQGYARPLTIAPNNSQASLFVRAAHDAEAANLGLWATCSR
jgi:micrococcal nuclease